MMQKIRLGVMGGFRDSLSIMIGYLPVSFSFGIGAVQAGIEPWLAVAASCLIYAGASQFMLLSLFGASGASAWITVPMVWLLNARHLLYGPSLAIQLKGQPSWLPSPLLTFGLTDEVFATAMGRMALIEDARREYWLLGLQIGAYLAWVGGTALGLVFAVDASDWPSALRDGLAFVLPALFLSLLMGVGGKEYRVAILGGGGIAVGLSLLLPSHHALTLAILGGAVLQGIMSRRRS